MRRKETVQTDRKGIEAAEEEIKSLLEQGSDLAAITQV
jgi:hypothetical protein